MALLDLEKELERAREGWPFSNGYEFEAWSAIWCEECVNYDGCPLLNVVLFGSTPDAWELRDDVALNRYTCAEFIRKEPLGELPLP